MKILRWFLSSLAFLAILIGAGEATTVLHIGPTLVAFVQSGGNLLGVFGVSPRKINPATAKVFTALSLFIFAGLASFGSYTAAHPAWAPAHLLLVHLVHGVGVIGTLMGIAGGVSSTPSVATPPAEPPAPPAAA